MQFLNPNALYLFISIPIVILLYFLKLRRKTQRVPSIMLWMTAVEDMKANVPFQRFRKKLLLPLQLLFLISAILGLSRPTYVRESRLGQHTVLIVDVSASMQSVKDNRSLFEMAQSDILKMIEERPENGHIMLVSGSLNPSIIVPFTQDSSKLRSLVENLSPTDSPSDLEKAIELAISSSQEIQGVDIIVLTDYNSAAKPEVPVQSEHSIRYIRYGGQNKNIAITRFGVSQTKQKKYQFFVEVQNFDDEPHDVLVWLTIDEYRIQSDSANIAGKEHREFIFELEDDRFDGEVLEVRLDIEDSLTVDNSVYSILHKYQKQRVLVVSDTPNLFLWQVLLTNPDVKFDWIRLNQYIGMTGYDVALFYKVVPHKIPDGNVLFVYPEESLPFMNIISKDQNVSVVSINHANPIMRDIELGELKVKESLVYEMPPWGIPVVESTSSPLIWLGKWRRRKGIIFAFDAFNPEVSGLVLTRSFPVLMAQCLEWLGKGNRIINPEQVKAGSLVEISVSEFSDVESVIIESPEGNKYGLPVNSPSITFENTYSTGIYQVYADNQYIGKFAVNLLDEDESNLIRIPKPEETKKEITFYSSSIKKSYREIWHYMAVIALVTLTLEWWIYHRRV